MTRTWFLTILASLLATPAHAAAPDPEFLRLLYPPELIMRYGRDVELRPAQRKAITKAVTKTQAATLEMQWDLQEAALSLTDLVRRERIDEEAALRAATRLMEIEGRIKRAHLRLLIQIKNQLDPDQQRALSALRQDLGSRPPPGAESGPRPAD